MLNLLVKPEVQTFIKEHQTSDLDRLLLNKSKYPGIPVDLVVDQIRAREKAKEKLPLWAATEGIIMPPLLSMEQCSSEQTAAHKASLFNGKVCIDLTGGAGVDSFYLSKQFDTIHYVEQNQELAEIAQHNFKLLGASNIKVHNTAAEAFLSTFEGKADLIYIDPARRDEENKVFRFESCSPNILPLQKSIWEKTEKVLVKASPMLDITLAASQLTSVKEVHVVSLANEVKELLLIQNKTEEESIVVKAIDLSYHTLLSFNLGESITPKTGSIQRFLYEPGAAILKSGGVNLLANSFPLIKLHENTHLFSSSSYVKNFPGRSFEVEKVVKYNKKEIAKSIEGNKANIAVRNFPDSVRLFRKKTGLKDGGDYYLFGYTAYDNSIEVAICKKYHK